MSIKRLGYKIEFVEGRHSKPSGMLSLTELNSWLVKEDIDAEKDNNGRGYDKCYIDVIYQVDNKKYAVHGIRIDLGDGSDPKIYEKDLKWADDKINDFVKTGNAGYGTIRQTDKKTVKDGFAKNDYDKLMDFLFANKYKVIRKTSGTKDGDSIEVYQATKEKNGKGLLFRYNRTKDIVEMAVYSDLATQSHTELNNLDEVKLRLKDSKIKDYDPPYAIYVKKNGKWLAWGGSNSGKIDRKEFLGQGYEDVRVVKNGTESERLKQLNDSKYVIQHKHNPNVVIAEDDGNFHPVGIRLAKRFNSRSEAERYANMVSSIANELYNIVEVNDSNDIVQGNYAIGSMNSAIRDDLSISSKQIVDDEIKECKRLGLKLTIENVLRMLDEDMYGFLSENNKEPIIEYLKSIGIK